MDADTSIAVGTWVLAAVTLVGGLAVVWGLFASTRVRKEEVSLLRRRETVRMYNSTVDVRTQSGTQLPHDRDATAVLEFIRASESEPEKRLAIRHYLNYWEGIAAAVDFEVLDAELLKKLVGSRLRSILHNYGSYITKQREILMAPKLFDALEGLAVEWGAQPLSAVEETTESTASL